MFRIVDIVRWFTCRGWYVTRGPSGYTAEFSAVDLVTRDPLVITGIEKMADFAVQQQREENLGRHD